MKFVYFLTIFLAPAILSGQNPATLIKDFNGDGFKDTLTTYYDGGSGFGGKFISLINGKSKEIFEIDNNSCFCEILNIIPISNNLLKKENSSFLKIIEKELLPEKKEPTHPSFVWLLNAYLNTTQAQNNTYFDKIIKSPMKWNSGNIDLPDISYMKVKGDTTRYFLNLKNNSDSNYSEKQGWLIYHGNNHLKIAKVSSPEKFQDNIYDSIWKTAHGIVISKGNKFSWVFVTDFNLSGAPEKLRRHSIGEIAVIKGYLIFQLVNADDFSNPIFILNVQNGVVARMNPKWYDYDSSFKIDEDYLKIKQNQLITAIPLNEIIGALEDL